MVVDEGISFLLVIFIVELFKKERFKKIKKEVFLKKSFFFIRVREFGKFYLYILYLLLINLG